MHTVCTCILRGNTNTIPIRFPQHCCTSTPIQPQHRIPRIQLLRRYPITRRKVPASLSALGLGIFVATRYRIVLLVGIWCWGRCGGRCRGRRGGYSRGGDCVGGSHAVIVFWPEARHTVLGHRGIPQEKLGVGEEVDVLDDGTGISRWEFANVAVSPS